MYTYRRVKKHLLDYQLDSSVEYNFVSSSVICDASVMQGC